MHVNCLTSHLYTQQLTECLGFHACNCVSWFTASHSYSGNYTSYKYGAKADVCMRHLYLKADNHCENSRQHIQSGFLLR